jgi:carbamate kinase
VLGNELARIGAARPVVAVVTQVVVDAHDPAFADPTKPIGPFYTEAQAAVRRERDGWQMIEDSGRGYRRIVPSPHPLRIVEAEQIKTLVSSGFVVIAAGGGGIPVVEREAGYEGVEAVIDKDLASALLASSLGIPLLVLSTGVERVAIHFRQPDQRFLDRLSVTEARRYLAEGEFPKGSMGPKVEAAITFLERGGSEVLITSPANLEQAFAGTSGTRIVADSAFASLSPSGS